MRASISSSSTIKIIQGIEIKHLESDKFTDIERATAKSIVFLGETGSGKTTLVNRIANSFKNIQFTDKLRYVLAYPDSIEDTTLSQTKEICAYDIRGSDGSCYTLIDTPGLLNTGGLTSDKDIERKIREFLFKICHSLFAICFVLKADTNRISSAQGYLFRSILDIFGSNVKNGCFFMATFADNKYPSVFHLTKTLGLGEKNFKINNSQLLPDESEEDDAQISEIFWNLAQSQIEKFFLGLQDLPNLDLSLIKTSIKSMQEDKICLISDNVHISVDELARLEKLKVQLEKEINDLKNKKDSKNIFDKLYSTFLKNYDNQNAKWLVYDSKFYTNYKAKDDFNDEEYSYIKKDENCPVCKGKCPWRLHSTSYIDKEKFFSDKKSKFTKNFINSEKEKDEISKKEALLTHLNQDYKIIEEQLKKDIINSLKSSPSSEGLVSSPKIENIRDFLEMFKKKEETEMKHGYQDRIDFINLWSKNEIMIEKFNLEIQKLF